MRKKTLGLLVGALVTTSVLAGYHAKGDNMTPAKAAIIETRADKMKDGDMMKDKSDKMMEDDMKKGKSDDMMKDKSDKMMQDEMKDSKSMKKDRMMNNKEMYDFTLKDLAGNDYKLSDNKGKKVYMKFWASWCSICLTGLEDLDKLAGENNDFEIVTVVAPGRNREMDTATFKKWFKELGHKNLKVLFDETGEVTEHYGIKVYPTSVYVGSNGTDTTVKAGHNSNDDIKDTIKNLK